MSLEAVSSVRTVSPIKNCIKFASRVRMRSNAYAMCVLDIS